MAENAPESLAGFFRWQGATGSLRSLSQRAKYKWRLLSLSKVISAARPKVLIGGQGWQGSKSPKSKWLYNLPNCTIIMCSGVQQVSLAGHLSNILLDD